MAFGFLRHLHDANRETNSRGRCGANERISGFSGEVSGELFQSLSATAPASLPPSSQEQRGCLGEMSGSSFVTSDCDCDCVGRKTPSWWQWTEAGRGLPSPHRQKDPFQNVPRKATFRNRDAVRLHPALRTVSRKESLRTQKSDPASPGILERTAAASDHSTQNCSRCPLQPDHGIQGERTHPVPLLQGGHALSPSVSAFLL